MYVYFIKSKDEFAKQLVKVGKANDPESRLRELQTGSPIKLRLIGKIKCKTEYQAFQLEKAIHRIFRNRHRRGEWFTLGDYNMGVIKRCIAAAEQSQQAEALNAEMDREFRSIIG